MGCLCQSNEGEEVINSRWPDRHVKGCPLRDPNPEGKYLVCRSG